jgi:sugar-specific transcriptional regulator TrmB
MGSSANENMRRIINFFKEFAKTADKIQERNKELQKRINDITNELKEKSPYTNSITKCESKLRELHKEIYDSMGKGCDIFL